MSTGFERLYRMSEEGDVVLFNGHKDKGRYAKNNPLTIDSHLQLSKVLKGVDNIADYRMMKADLGKKRKIGDKGLEMTVAKARVFLDDHGCDLGHLNYKESAGILESLLNVRLAYLKYSQMAPEEEVEASNILEVGVDVYRTFRFDCKEFSFVPPTYLCNRKEGDKKYVMAIDVLDFLKKLDFELLCLIRYYQNFDLLSAYVQIHNMQELPC